MAAAQRTRRRTQLSRRKKQTTRRIRTPRRRPLRKQREHQENQGGKAMAKRYEPPKHLKHPCDEFVSKVLSRLHQDRIPISTKAKGKMISFIRRFYNRISEQAKCSKKDPSSSAIGSKDLQKALKRVMRKKEAMELAKTIRKVSRHC